MRFYVIFSIFQAFYRQHTDEKGVLAMMNDMEASPKFPTIVGLAGKLKFKEFVFSSISFA